VESTSEVQQTQITANIFGLLALRTYRTDRAAGIRRVTPKTALFLDCYRLHRQKEIAALSPMEWMRQALAETRAEVAALTEAAARSDDLATAAAILVRVEGAAEFVQFLAGKLEEVADG
jgi:hypothetical protein